jgi:hypothetical protein
VWASKDIHCWHRDEGRHEVSCLSIETLTKSKKWRNALPSEWTVQFVWGNKKQDLFDQRAVTVGESSMHLEKPSKRGETWGTSLITVLSNLVISWVTQDSILVCCLRFSPLFIPLHCLQDLSLDLFLSK